ncbi:Nuf2 family protein [Nitzschia inconspicua]|uniref:Nuf2 family protein n=1 Tax=Nitzschia inconspicua TaxID=303405 RepID=A0A9K3KRP1_9STRA|nr:Nuf2 family protein [Nitzschia inconspicua]
MSNYMPSDFSTPSKKGGVDTISHTHYIFPVLKNSDILQCMSEVGIEVSKPELTEPQRHKDKIRKIFWHLLDYCCGVTEEELQGKTPKGMDEIVPESELELHDDFVDILFFKEMRHFMKTCGITDFSWKDLHYPTAKRLRCQLSAIINMAKFREEQLGLYEQLNEPRTELLEVLERLHTENEELRRQLEEVQAESSIKMEEFDRVAKECQELESDIARSNKLQASKREEATLLKKEVTTLKDELASATWTLQETQAEEDVLKGQIVSSPDRRKRELQMKKDYLEKEKEETRRLQQEITDGKAKMARLQQAIKDLQETMVLQRQVLDEASKYEEVKSQVEETKKEVEANQQKTAEIEESTEQAERSLFRLEEKLSHTRKQYNMKMDAVQDRLDVAREQLLIVEKERRDGMAKVEAGEAEVQNLKEQMKAEQEQTEEEIASMIAAYKELEKAFYDRNEKRMQAIEAAT